jgi:hypothetical protein
MSTGEISILFFSHELACTPDSVTECLVTLSSVRRELVAALLSLIVQEVWSTNQLAISVRGPIIVQDPGRWVRRILSADGEGFFRVLFFFFFFLQSLEPRVKPAGEKVPRARTKKDSTTLTMASASCPWSASSLQSKSC